MPFERVLFPERYLTKTVIPGSWNSLFRHQLEDYFFISLRYEKRRCTGRKTLLPYQRSTKRSNLQRSPAFDHAITARVGKHASPLTGIASAGYVRCIGWSETGEPKAYVVILAPIIVFVSSGMVSVRFPEILGNRRIVVQGAFGSQLGLGLLCWLLFLRPLEMALCLKSGEPGGLFAPTMTFGELLVGLLGEGWSDQAPAN